MPPKRKRARGIFSSKPANNQVHDARTALIQRMYQLQQQYVDAVLNGQKEKATRIKKAINQLEVLYYSNFDDFHVPPQ
jgi:hypothetical protein